MKSVKIIKKNNKKTLFWKCHLHVTDSVYMVIEGDPKHNCGKLIMLIFILLISDFKKD